MKKIALLFILATALTACNNDDDSPTNVVMSVNLSQNWDGTNVTAADFGTTEFTNENGEVLTISKLRYLISKVTLYNEFGDAIELDGYKLVDLADESTSNFIQNAVFPPGNYTRISFVYGFNEEDNIDDAYTDLNAASWNWPDMLGGGYHFMQFEGNFNNSNNESQTYAYHNGTARVSMGEFEQNFITIDIDGLNINSNTTIDIQMNLAQWFKSPNTWDLNELNNGLMMNYDAQKMMNANGQNVFSVQVD